MQLDSKNVYLLLGSNLGDREMLLTEAVEQIGNRVGPVFSRSSVYETAAWGKADQPSFLNMAVGVNTMLSPLEVLQEVLAIEEELGRVRKEKWGSRLIDIDVILFADQIVNIGEQLQIPHPQMQYRRFVLEPLTEIAGEVIHPILQKSVSEILGILDDNLTVTKI
ncbi:2-amino-4-hydroxy-6-hydroxymethyldihydropteridinediphosphokinase [Pedobacter steynii]|uniref:2-amino-4-hydroxy-6-hydroxymethyldihydropteridine pyrophosphokinase n=1 Tax=Pedobacter steynii TaxID=430522 RepID=A0A1G9MHZ4_9SPHI|nr:2-amino-4-hydroxy-6-hydroxymethyldihydropteridine diphosphokinase [Pedobacter steynii]NQX39597.1 2-amino-4-hydroxy-6-hydroxymethyldihydropteridine diphosphokinase [Pedobacter steynii]SDL73527.1 2-amino-4-hydroxy-6-hydroxymethyldihydropteridinediphosphokinase [Pedobacter steynii]